MSDQSDNNKRILKNTLLLYFRMLITMAISFYTSRVVLNTLGIENYGVCNIVGGVVSMLAFFNSSMATSTQRFLNYEMGKKDKGNLRKIFSNAINAHYIIGFISFIFLETIGLWFVYNKLNIPTQHFQSAVWVYHCSILSFFISIISTPYNAAIIANEKMGIYAYFSVIEVVFKLLIVYLLVIIPFEKLKLYGLLQLIVSVIMRFLYNIYCIHKFPECKYYWCWDKKTMVSLFNFSGWMVWGCISDMLSKQGTNILINIFFGPIFNAARAIAVQVQMAIYSFVLNFMTAVKPQIIKSYSSKEYEYMYKLVYSSSKLGYYMLFILLTPILIYTEFFLQIWLNQVPEATVVFIRFILIELLITSAYTPIAQINQASGQIKKYQIAISFLYILNFVLTYIAFKMGFSVYTTFIISVFIAIIGLFVRVIILRNENNFPAAYYLKNVIFPLFPISLLSLIIPILIYINTESTIVSIFSNSIIGVLVSVVIIWKLGLNRTEREFILTKLQVKVKTCKND